MKMELFETATVVPIVIICYSPRNPYFLFSKFFTNFATPTLWILLFFERELWRMCK